MRYIHAKNKGFTLVELSIVLVIIGIILGAVLKGQELINNSKAKRVTNDMKGIEAMLWTYYDRKGHWPGDCDINGIIGYSPSNTVVPDDTADVLSNGATPTDSCDYSATTPTTEAANTVFSDMRVSRVAGYEIPNLVLAKHVVGGSFRIGGATNSTVTVPAIVVYDLPAWMAKMVDVSIDSTESGTSGRVRNWVSTTGIDTGSAWPSDANNEQSVSLAYFFDKTLP